MGINQSISSRFGHNLRLWPIDEVLPIDWIGSVYAFRRCVGKSPNVMPLTEILLVTMGLLALAIISAGVFRKLPIPYTVMLVIIGVGLGELSRSWPPLSNLAGFQLNHDLVFFVFLPALIFESAFNLDARQLIKDLAPIVVLAVPALLITTALIALGSWWLLGIDPIVAILFGALISATDPAAVIALLKEIEGPMRLTVLVEGESLLNDATAIVLFTIVLSIALSGVTPTLGGIGWAILNFCWVFLGGLIVGCLFGLVTSERLHRLKSSLSSVLAMSIVLAYVSFIIAEHLLHISGVMAAAAASVTLAGLGVSRMSAEESRAIGETWELIALISNSLLYLLVGLSVDPAKHALHASAIAIAVVLVLVSRAAVIYSLVPATTKLFSIPKVSLGERHIMWWGGLKGGLAIAIVLSIPADFPERDLLLNLTLGVVLFTLLINAPTIRPLMVKLGMDRLTAEEQSELDHTTNSARHAAHDGLQTFRDASLLSENSYQRVAHVMEETFSTEVSNGEKEEEPAKRPYEVYLTALRIENEVVARLFEGGVISQYTYLDIRNLLQRDRDYHTGNIERVTPTTRENPFSKFEIVVLGWLREHDWAAGLLSRYQHTRLTQQLQRDIAGILMCQAVLETLDDQGAQTKQIRDIYRERMSHRKRRLEPVQEEFPKFYRSFEYQLVTGMALTRAKQETHQELHHGEIGAKAFEKIDGRIENSLRKLPTQASESSKISIPTLLQQVPLLQGLSPGGIQAICAHAHPVTFLPGDIVIGEGQKGDALYIIVKGRMEVSRRADNSARARVGTLSNGDFFGETGLLGVSLRTATVTTLIPSTLLRVARRDIMALSERNPEVRERLAQAKAERER